MSRSVITIAISGKKGHGKDTLGKFMLDVAKQQGFETVHRGLADPLKEEAAKAIAIYESQRSEPTRQGFGWYTADMERIDADFEANAEVWAPILQWFNETYDISWAEAVPVVKNMLAAALSEFDDPGGDGSNSYTQESYETVLAEFHHPAKKLAWRILLQWWGTEFRRRLCGETFWRDQLIAFNKALPDKTVHLVSDVRFPDEFDMARNDLTNGFLIRVIRSDLLAKQQDMHISETALDHKKPSDWNAVVYNDLSLLDLQKGAGTIFINALMWARLA
jgi:hypothetical protein